MYELEIRECSCRECQKACEQKPGWFAPGQVELTAKELNITVQELFDQYLTVDYWEANNPIFVLSPATTTNTPGQETPYDPLGTCIFYKEGKCSIHSTKPAECSFYDHDKQTKDMDKNRRKILTKWVDVDNQQQIETLLGRKPQISNEDYDPISLLLKMMGIT